jgi:hypothetical protein
MAYNANDVLKKLNELGAVNSCQRCGANKWQLQQDGFASITVQTSSRNVSLGGPAWPLAVVTCTKCGNTVFHNLGTLGVDAS